MTDVPPAPAPTDPPADPPTDPPAPQDPPETGDLAAELEKWKAMSRKNEAEAKANRKAAERLAEIEREKLSETERLQAELAEARAAAETASTEALRLKVATSKGLDPVLAERLRGATEEEMAEDADRLLAVMKPTKPPAPAGGADGGPQGAPKPGQLTRAALAGMTPDEIVDAKAKGLLDDVLAGKA